MQARITGLSIYPVKSCRGIGLAEAALAPTGLCHDRHWMVVRLNGRFVTQRELPRMALIETRVLSGALTLAAPGRPVLEVPRAAAGAARAVTVWKFSGRGLDCGDTAAQWLSEYLETPLRLVAFDGSVPRDCSPDWTGEVAAHTEFSDGFPILVLSRASLAELNTRLAKALPMERFRPNIVIDGVAAYDEDRIFELRSEEITLRMVKSCTRCIITTTEQSTGERDGVEPLATLKTYRFDKSLGGVQFGQNAIIVRGAGKQLRVGQDFEIAWRRL